MKRFIVLLIVFCAGCADMQMFVKDDFRGKKPARILIGNFFSRDMNYDPFLADELREQIRFAFFKNSYDVRLVKREADDKKTYDNPADVAALCASSGADVFISGVVSRKEAGSFADRKVYYSASFIIRDKNGNISGEGTYSDRNLDAPVFIKEAAETFVDEFVKQVRG